MSIFSSPLRKLLKTSARTDVSNTWLGNVNFGPVFQGQGHGVGGPAVDDLVPAVLFDVQLRVIRVFDDVGDDHLGQYGFQVAHDAFDQVVGHGPGRGDALQFQGDGVGFVHADPDGNDFFIVQRFQHHDRRFGYLVHDQADDIHFDEFFHCCNLYSIKTGICQL